MTLAGMPLPEITNLPLYLNIAFFAILGMGMLVGFLRGFKNSLYAFIVTAIFYVVFFLTIDLVVNKLWSMNLSFLGGLLANLDAQFQSVTSLSEAVPLALSIYVPDLPAAVLENANLLEFVAGLGIFIVKIAYTIIYFTVIQIIYRLLTFIIRVIFFNTPKAERKYRSKNRGFGALFGLLSGVMSLYVTLIIFGGIMSITESIMTLAPEIPETEDVVLVYPRQGIYQANYSVIPLQEEENPLEAYREMFEFTNDIISAYNENILVGFSSEITIAESETESKALNLYLFDSVLSFSYKEEKIAIRDELSVYAEVAGGILNSEFMETQDLADIDGALIQTSMEKLADSHLFTSILPLAVDVGSDMLEVDIPIEKAQIYAIDWEAEVMQIGEVAALVFDFVNTAGLLEEDPNLETVVFDGDTVRDIFDALGDSQLVTLAAYVALEPVLEGLAEDNPIKAIITVPEGMNWKDEFVAMGEIIGAVLDTQITYAQLQSGDPMVIIQALAQLDFTVILDSKIITHALINVLQGAGGLLDGEELSFLVIPDDIIWLDELDGDGNIIQNGELRNILLAVNQIAQVAANLDFNNLTAAAITELSDDAIDALFESDILIASITETVKTLDFGELALLIPDDVYDDDGYLLKTELIALVGALKTIVTALPCDDGDEECATVGFDYSKVLSLESATIDEVFESLILEATIGNMVYEMGAEALVIPETATVLRTVLVEGVAHEIVTANEIKKVFAAASVFEFDNIDDIEFDETMILDIASDEDKIDTILDSEIIAATAGSMLYEMGEDALTIPAEAVETITVGGADETIVTASEIRKLLLAVAALEITSLEGMEIGPDILKNLATTEDETVLDEDKADQIFDSVILQATISGVLIDLVSGETQVLSIPYFDEDGDAIRYDNGVDDFEYITVDELKAIVRAILVLDITDFEGIDIDTLDLDTIIDNTSIILGSAILQATISDQIVNMDTDMIVVPDEDLLGEDVKITTGEGEQATTFIAKAELEKALEAIQVLALDLENPAFDETIINNLASETNPEVLDDDKLTTLLDSTIIHASMSKMIIDLAEGDGETEAVIVVPYFDESENAVRIEDGLGNEYVTKTELINLFKAYYSLDITDFNAVDSLEISTILDNFDTLILSATLHATISDQVINLEADAIVIPEVDFEEDEVVISVGDGLTETIYIRQSELRATFDALEVLNIDYENPTFDATMIDNLAEDEDPETLDEVKLDTLFESLIIHASISKMLFDLTEGEEAVLSVPYFDAEENEVRFEDINEVEYVSETELRNALKAMHALDISDFNNVDTLGIDEISANFDVLIASAILHATISDQVINMESDAIVIPEIDHLDQPVIITVGVLETATTYIDSDELQATFDALEVMNIDFENPVFDATIINNLAEDEDPETLDEVKLDTLFDSMIIHASISKMLFDLTEGEEAVLSVPYYDSVEAEVRFDDGHGVEYVTELELRSALAAMNKLGISDFNNVETLTLTDINANFDVLIASAILHATISDQLLTLESDDVNIPYYDYAGGSIRIAVGLLEEETIYIDQDELENTFIALELLGVDDLDQVNIDIDLTDFYAPENRNTLIASAIVHSAISKQLVEVEALTVPYYDAELNDVRITRGSIILETDTEYVSDTEIHALFEVLQLLNITTLENVEIDLDLTEYYDPEPRDILMGSASVHLEISNQLFGIGAETLAIPYKDIEDQDIRKTVGDALQSTDSEYVVKTEIHALFEVLQLLNITTLDNVQIDLDLTEYYDPAPRDILMGSASVHLEISNQLFGIGAETLAIPYKDIEDQDIRKNVGDALQSTDSEYVVKTEIHALFEVLQLLNITTLDNVQIDLDLRDYYESGPRDILMASASVHGEITKQVLDIDDATLDMPFYNESGSSIRVTRGVGLEATEYLVTAEIHALFEVLEFLGIIDFNTVNMEMDLSDLYIVENRNILLASAAVHLKVSSQMLELSTRDVPVIVVPEKDVNSQSITVLRANHVDLIDDVFLKEQEIHYFFEGLEILDLPIDNINQFNGSFDLTILYDYNNRVELLKSATMHATISDQLIGLDTEQNVIIVPEVDVLESEIIRTVDSVLFLMDYEIHDFFEGIEELGLLITDVNDFNGSFDLSVMYVQESRDIILASASLHATISDQLIGLDTEKNVIVMPEKDIASTTMIITRGTTDFLISTEIDNFFEGIEELGLVISDVNDFNGSFNMSVMYEQASRDIILASAALHATISDQLIKLDTEQNVIIVPSVDIASGEITRLVETVTFMMNDEIDNFFEGLEELGLLIDDVNDFDGSFDLSKMYELTSRDIILASATLHATISEQLIDLDTRAMVIVPDSDYLETVSIRVVRGVVEFIDKNEVHHFFEAIEILELPLEDISNFNGEINLGNFFASEEPVEYGNNQTTLLASAIMHATVSDQILGLGSTKLIVPERDVTETLITALIQGTDYVIKDEIKALINALDILGITDITAFGGTITLTNFYSDGNQDILLLSASMHATISDQILGLGTDKLVVPAKDFAEADIRVTNSVSVEFVVKTEIKALIEALEVLEVTNITGFTGAITLSHFFESANPATYSDNQDTLLASAAMHATISDQVLDLGASALIVPDTDVLDNPIRKTVGITEFIYKTEIKAIIDSLDVLGLNSIDSMTGAFSLARLDTTAKQDKLLTSASMHATISDKVFAIDDNILYVPAKRQDNLTDVKVQAGLPGDLLDFVTKDEIKALIDALIIMGYGDLSSFTAEFELDEVFANPGTVLLSASIQAMFSDRVINDTGGTLQIPDYYYGTVDLIRIALVDVTYIEYDELVALILALDDLDLDDFSTFSFTPGIIFLLDDFDTILASEIIQATISDNLLASPTLDETAPAGSGKLIVPSFFRQDITVETLGSKQIEKVELDRLLTSLKLLGISNFGDGMSGTSITSIFLNETSRNTFLESGSIHVTTDNLLKGNMNIGGSIPDLAKETAYGISGVTTKAEIIYFIVAVNTIGTTDFTQANFTVASIAALTPAEQDVILTSMIVRNKITPDLETICSNPLNSYPLTDDDYMSGVIHDFLKKQSVLDIIDYYY